MKYLTGITRENYTVQCVTAGAVEGRVYYDGDYTYIDVARTNVQWGMQWGSIAGFSAAGTARYIGAGVGTISRVAAAWMGTAAGAFAQSGATYGPPLTTGTLAVSLNAGGTCTIVCSIAELCIDTAPLADLYRGCQSGDLKGIADAIGDTSPTYGSSDGETPMPDDTPSYQRVSLFWRAPAGAVISVTAQCGTVTHTASGTVPAGDGWELPDYVGVTRKAWSYAYTAPAPVAAQLSMTPTIDGAPITSTVGTQSLADAYGTVYIDDTSAYARSTNGTAYAYVSEWRPERPATFNARVDAMGTPYAGTLVAAVQARNVYRWNEDIGAYGWWPQTEDVPIINGTATYTYTAREFSYLWQLHAAGGGTAGGGSAVYERAPVWLTLRNDAMGTVGEDTDDWRCLFRAFPYGCWDVAQAGSHVLDGSFAGTTSVVRSFGGTAISGYRYMQVDTDRALMPIDVTLVGQVGTVGVTRTWSGTTDGAGVYQWDLCYPHNVTDATDPKDTRNCDLDDTVSYAGPYWGIDYLTSVTMEFAGTVNVAANGLVLMRRERTLLQGMEPLKQGADGDWIHVTHQENFGGESVSDTYLRVYLTGDTDGRRSAECNAISKTITTGLGAGTVLTLNSLDTILRADLCNADARNTGWSGVAGTCGTVDSAEWGTVRNGYCNLNRPASWLGGGGLLYAGGSWSPAYAIGVNTSATVTLQAQALYDEITDWPAGCGDAWGAGTAGTALPLLVGKTLRGGAWGLHLSAVGGTPTLGTVIDLMDGAGTLYGQGTTGTLGYYYTGTPHRQGESYAGVTPHESAISVACSPLRARRWRRACFRAGTATEQFGGGVSYDCSEWGRHVRAYVRAGTIWTGVAQNGAALAFADATTGIEGDHPCIRIERQTVAQRWLLCYDSGGAVFARTSTDEAASWNVANTVFASGSYPCVALAPDGRQFYYAVSGSAIIGKCYSPNAGLVDDLGTVIPSFVPGPIDAGVYAGPSRTVRVALLYAQGGTVTAVTSVNGKDFS